MATITEQIEYDVKCISTYFQKLKLFVEEQQIATNEGPEDFIAVFRAFDMVYNIYGLVDYWHPKLCDKHSNKRGTSRITRKIPGISDLAHRHNYLIGRPEFNLDRVQLEPSYNALNKLRDIRNADAHDGGYCDPKNALVYQFTEDYLWESLEHAKTYLCVIAAGLA